LPPRRQKHASGVLGNEQENSETSQTEKKRENVKTRNFEAENQRSSDGYLALYQPE
jgi:hypothetical protein